MKERTILAIKLISSHLLLLPVLLSLCVFFPQLYIPVLSIAQTLLIIIYLAGYWEFFGLRMRILYSLLIEFIMVTLLIRAISSSRPFNFSLMSIIIFGIIQLYLIFQLIKIILVIFIKDKTRIEISFPLKNGNYIITDGGNSKICRLMNYHYYSTIHRRKRTNNSMKFATDIIKSGQSKKVFLPPDNQDYPIFSEKVYCPMDGIVFKIENDIEDNVPFSGNYPYSTGNTIVIKNGDNYLLIGHLKKGSIRVDQGDRVRANELIAEAGNSGFSERPHVHMQLIHSQTDKYWSGLGICMTYAGKNLYKNRIIKKSLRNLNLT
jgi:hypothetical protein